MFAPSSSGSRRPSVVAGPSTPNPQALRTPPLPRPRGNSYSRPQPILHTQPTTVKLTPSALRSLLRRLTHPPPPPTPVHGNTSTKGKERARWLSGWTLRIQPEPNVKLEDVLDRKHLPPLGLKDFEEWLLFVEGTPENLYFILWLREYTNRYATWTSSLRTKHDQAVHISSSQLNPLKTSTRHPHVVVPSERERPFASLGMAMSSLSLPPPSPQRSQAPYTPYPTFSSPPASPTARTSIDNDSIIEEDGRRSTGYRTIYTHPPNPDLAMFYLRAKETFLTPNAEYELDVSSEVLSAFHITTMKSNKKPRRDSGVAFHEDEIDHERGRLGGFIPSARVDLTMSGTNAYPPDPDLFSELGDIVQERLRQSLGRLVVATYNNVGMPRAYCGSAGGCAIALVTSAPPIIASFAAGGPRWYRLFALPGLWLGLTIFISAMYGVCMMIYVFGDLRQLRSFELARPPLALAEAKPKDHTVDTIIVPPSPSTHKTREKERRGSVFTLKKGLGGKNRSDDRISAGASQQEETLPFRKESLVPVVTPVPLLLMPARPRKAHTTGSVSVRSKSRSPPQSPVEAGVEGGVEGKPVLRLDIWGGNATATASGSNDVQPENVQVPAKAVVRERGAVDVGPHVVPSGEEENEDEEEDESEYDEDEEDDESGSGAGSDADDERGSSPYSHDGQRHRSRDHRRRAKRHHRPPPIVISDAFYDEHPSPEGPATAPAEWFEGTLERRAAQNPVPVPSMVQSEHPLWPDYSYPHEEHTTRRGQNETAVFIGPFLYDGSESGSSCAHNYVGRGANAARIREEDLEKGPSASVPLTTDQVQAAQPMDEFSFDGLPARRPKLRVKVASEEVAGVGQIKEAKAERLREQRRTDPSSVRGRAVRKRSPSPGSSVSTSTNGKPERWYWVFVAWMQVKCQPKNMVDVIVEEEKECVESMGKGKGRQITKMTPAQRVMGEARQSENARAGKDVATVGAAPPEPAALSPAEPAAAGSTEERERKKKSRPTWRARLRKVYLSVPAFSAPLTPVLNPLVGRAQWEIVVRSAALSVVLSCVIVGGLLGAPET